MASQGELLGIYHWDIPSVCQNKLKGLTLSQQQDDLRKEEHMGAQVLKQRECRFLCLLLEDTHQSSAQELPAEPKGRMCSPC